MSETPYTSLRKPSATRPYTIGGTATVSLFLWIAVLANLHTAHTGDVPLPVYLAMLGAASTMTIVAVALVLLYTNQKTICDDHAAIFAAVADVSREMEQVSAKIDKIDPWQFYAAAAADLLPGQDRRT